MQVLSRCILAPFPCPPQPLDQFVVQLLSRVQLFATSWTAARQVSLSFAISEPKESESEVAQSCPTLCDPMDCILPGSSVHGIFQAIVLEWIAISFSRGSSQPRDWTQVNHIVDIRILIHFVVQHCKSKTTATEKKNTSNTYWIIILY